MGIRNLAYCILDVPVKKKELPSIHDWHRLAISTAPIKSIDPEVPTTKEPFDPATLSHAAYNLLKNRLLPANPTHVLIERQRFRSMSGASILEWTIRVNMLESILHAVLYTLKAEGTWKGEVKVILPQKVGPFWVGEDAVVAKAKETRKGEKQMVKGRKSKSMKIINKGLKIDLVRKWLENGEMVEMGNPEVELVKKAYMEKWDRLPGRRRVGEDEVKMGKLDDLADCLLQGLAWIQWEENKKTALKSGVEALLGT